MEVISAFEKLLSDDEKEKVIQKYLFKHLWLLHPSWDRAATDRHMEKNVRKALDVEIDNLTDEEKRARFDIAFKSAPDRHIVIELKRYGARISAPTLIEQLMKYKSAIEKALKKFPDRRSFEIIAVLGHPPHGMENEESQKMLGIIKARWVTYDELIRDALNRYDGYLKANEALSTLTKLLNRI